MVKRQKWMFCYVQPTILMDFHPVRWPPPARAIWADGLRMKMAAAKVEFVKIRGQNALEWLLITAVFQQKFGVFFIGLDGWVLRYSSTVASGSVLVSIFRAKFPFSSKELVIQRRAFQGPRPVMTYELWKTPWLVHMIVSSSLSNDCGL